MARHQDVTTVCHSMHNNKQLAEDTTAWVENMGNTSLLAASANEIATHQVGSAKLTCWAVGSRRGPSSINTNRATVNDHDYASKTSWITSILRRWFTWSAYTMASSSDSVAVIAVSV